MGRATRKLICETLDMDAKTLRQRLRNDGAVKKMAEASANSPVALQPLIQKERIGLPLIASIMELYLERGRLVSWHEAGAGTVTLLATIVKDLNKGLQCRIPRGAAPVLSLSIVSARLLARGYGRSEEIAFNASATPITSLASLALR